MDDEKRALPRHRTLKGARIVVNDGFSTFQCTVRNLSDIGAQLRVASIVGIPDTFQLVLDDKRNFPCTVIWRRETELGVSFR
ncbi:MAG TPA: PilZ domain-containing protein [Devosia sp.]|nr:PilZ domain-containing protein [Devosia sp.]